jgi:UDP-GlcNAc3NAcA epimerase
MRKLKIISIVGARPQFVKAAALSKEIALHPGVDEHILHTGQHYDDNMSDLFFRQMSIPKPTYHLGIGSGSHGQQTAKMLVEIESVLLKNRPDWVVVYGDTNSTLAGVLAASKIHVPVAHVEAGLRSFNRRMPEEINRILTDHASDLLFAPTTLAVKNLRNEGVSKERICLTGDIMYDAALIFAERAKSESQILEKLNLKPQGYILATVHRAENTDDKNRLASIFRALSKLSREIPVVVPLHPRTRSALQQCCDTHLCDLPIRLIDPVGYLDMVALEYSANLITTDSGGVQKEAFFFRVPCVTLRDETEWQELVELGWNRLVSPDSAEKIFNAISEGIKTTGMDSSPYGDGTAAKKILYALIDGAVKCQLWDSFEKSRDQGLRILRNEAYFIRCSDEG